jgi:hypothetical protein
MAKISIRLGSILSIAVGLAFAGCSGSQQAGQQTFPSLQEDVASTPMPSAIGHRPSMPLARQALSGPLLYASDDGYDAIDIFPLTGPNQKQVGSITSGTHYPWGLSLDASNTLYVGNFGNGTVSVYPFGSTTPSMTYSHGPREAMYALADGAGHVYVSGKDPARHNRGHVVEYNVGNNTPIAHTLLGSEADGIALDGHGNLYVAFRRTGPNCGIAEFGPGLTNKRFLPMVIDQPQGLLLDNAGNLVVVESADVRIKVFPPGATTPSVTVTIGGIGNLAQLAMQSDETTLWVSSEGGYVYSMPYPLTSGTVATEYESGMYGSNGIAVTPH